MEVQLLSPHTASLFLCCTRRLILTRFEPAFFRFVTFFFVSAPRVFKDMGSNMSSRIGNKAEEKAEFKEQLKYAKEFGAYDESYKTDLDVKKFNDAFQTRTGRIINALVNDRISLPVLKEVASCFRDMDNDVATLLGENQKDIWNTPHLNELVREYSENSFATLEFCSLLESCLSRARKDQLDIQIAVQPIQPGASLLQYRKILDVLGKTAWSSFPEDFFRRLEDVKKRHVEMLEKLHAKIKKMDKKQRNVRVWKKISSIIFMATYATVIICSVVAAAIAAPPAVAAVLAAVTPMPTASMGKWVNSFWIKYERTIEGKREILNAMKEGSSAELKDLDKIKDFVERLKSSISSILRSLEICVENDNGVQNAVEEMIREQKNFSDEIDCLSEHVRECTVNIVEGKAIL